jgi:hypothetical protein
VRSPTLTFASPEERLRPLPPAPLPPPPPAPPLPMVRVCPTNTNTDWMKTKQSHIIVSHGTGLTDGRHAQLYTTLPIIILSAAASSTRYSCPVL